MEDEKQSHKSHRGRSAGGKVEKKKQKNFKRQQQLPPGATEDDASRQQRNPKAFAVQAADKLAKRFRRTQDIKSKKMHIPVMDRTPVEPPPFVVAVVGPPKVGKSTLMQCLIKNYTRQTLSSIRGPVTIVSAKKQRLTFIECNNDINAMIDVAKIADVVLLLVDASFGFEMETFEFLNICQVHGFPRIMGVLTHLDHFKNNKMLRRTKKRLKHRFWTEIYQGAKLFYLSGLVHDEYQKTEIHNLGRFISVMKLRPLQWRSTHPYMLADRMEDLTSPELIRQHAACDRVISLYGYLRGTQLKEGSDVHIAGSGKTVAYLAPVVQQIFDANSASTTRPPTNSPQALVLVPGRELAEQVYTVIKSLCRRLGVRADMVVGGRGTKKLLAAGRHSDCDILVATPGVLWKLLCARIFTLEHVNYVVVDEADSLLDDSFNDIICPILRKIKFRAAVPVVDDAVGAQAVFTGATIPKSLHTILDGIVAVESLMHVTGEYLHRVMPHVTQKFIRMHAKDAEATDPTFHHVMWQTSVRNLPS
ncbi:PREDICTED: ribosome biogenesis protein BMS1 homolog [Priapulus caudatus]|uniref:Ribosome biogenesis protein BMS1 homolog n=1 Tax=Priapulus caudatus TaxID=37621 RepID=A0ABM1EY38_PRICU|nr:PREDICTED: ribosome biogenesis protein BMS1 homolog [Priapulus caudatus]